jgi:hypothetical protein
MSTARARPACEEPRELNWLAIHLPFLPRSRDYLRPSAQMSSLVMPAAKIDKEKRPHKYTSFQSGLRFSAFDV